MAKQSQLDKAIQRLEGDVEVLIGRHILEVSVLNAAIAQLKEQQTAARLRMVKVEKAS